MLYLGPPSGMTRSLLSPALCRDPAYMDMRRERLSLVEMQRKPGAAATVLRPRSALTTRTGRTPRRIRHRPSPRGLFYRRPPVRGRGAASAAADLAARPGRPRAGALRRRWSCAAVAGAPWQPRRPPPPRPPQRPSDHSRRELPGSASQLRPRLRGPTAVCSIDGNGPAPTATPVGRSLPHPRRGAARCQRLPCQSASRGAGCGTGRSRGPSPRPGTTKPAGTEYTLTRAVTLFGVGRPNPTDRAVAVRLGVASKM